MNPAEQKLKELLDIVIAEGGSDLHLTVGTHPIIRVDGALIPLLQQPKITAGETREIMKNILPESRLKILERNQSVDFAYSYKDKGRFRINSYIVQGVPAIAMRLIPHEIRTISNLNLPPILDIFTHRSRFSSRK